MLLTARRGVSNRSVISPIGLDIGRQSLRAAQLERRGQNWRVLRVTSWHRRASETGDQVPDGLRKRMARALQQAGYVGRRVTAGLSAPDVELHTLDIPDHGDLQDAARFADAVQWELERVAGIGPDGSASDFWRLPKSNATRTTAIGVVAPLACVKAADDLVKSVGLECARVDSTACAIARLGAAIHGITPDEPQRLWSVLDAGLSAARLVLAVGETPVLVRHLGNGGERWTQTISESLGLSSEAAETHKRDYGIARVPQGQTDPSMSEIGGMIDDILRLDLNGIATEVERSYEYAIRCYPEAAVGGMLLVGGGAELKGLDRYLAEHLGIAVTTLRDALAVPGAHMAADASIRESLSPYGCALGLAVDSEAFS